MRQPTLFGEPEGEIAPFFGPSSCRSPWRVSRRACRRLARLTAVYPEKYQEIITAWLNSSLVDPKSVQIKWLGEPRPGELDVGKGQKVAGFLVDFSVNARNIFGAYTGSQKHTALIRDGQVVTATGFVVH